jgi:hypothetical protein
MTPQNDVIAAGGSAVIVGRPGRKLDDAVANLSRSGSAWSVAADLADRDRPPPAHGGGTIAKQVTSITTGKSPWAT